LSKFCVGGTEINAFIGSEQFLGGMTVQHKGNREETLSSFGAVIRLASVIRSLLVGLQFKQALPITAASHP
jgi:hypothetical protein